MRQKLSIIFLIFSILSGTACGNKSEPGPEGTASPEVDVETMFWATISEISGSVMTRQASETDFSEAVDGAIIQPNGEVMTGESSRARLDLSTGAIVRVSANSIFSLLPIEKQPDGLFQHLKLEIGRIWIVLNGGSLDVETPSGVASVRGSYMSVSYYPETDTVVITCLEGTCTLGNESGSVTLTAGQTATIQGAGSPPVVGEMSDEDFNEWLNTVPESLPIILIESPTAPPATQPPATQPPATETVPTEPSPTEPVVVVPPSSGSQGKPSTNGNGAQPTEPPPTAPPLTAPPPTAPPATQPPPVLLTPTVAITSVTPTSPVHGQSVTVNFKVTPPAGGVTPTGTVDVLANGEPFCTANLRAAGSASCTGIIFGVFTQDLVAYYYGNANYYPAQSAAWLISVAKANTYTTIQSQSMNPSAVDLPVTFMATVDYAPPGSGTPYGNVTFDILGGEFPDSCVVNAAPWSCTYTFIMPGSYTITATYSGDGNFTASISPAVSHVVWPTADTQFLNPSGPNSPFSVVSNVDCPQNYRVEAIDIHGVNEVRVEYSINDFTFATYTQILLQNTSGNIWESNIVVPSIGNETVYWRFIGVDGLGNKTFFGAGVPYTDGYPGTTVAAYSFLSQTVCP